MTNYHINRELAVAPFVQRKWSSTGLGLNAGHDLNLDIRLFEAKYSLVAGSFYRLRTYFDALYLEKKPLKIQRAVEISRKLEKGTGFVLLTNKFKIFLI